MSHMAFGGVAGCCAAYNIYNLGGAHGHPRAKNQEEFELRFLNQTPSSLNFAITNNYQLQERQYLETMGFKTVETSGLLRIHAIGSHDLREYLEARRTHLNEYKAKILEEKKKSQEVKTKSVFAPVTAQAAHPVVRQPAVRGPAGTRPFRGWIYSLTVRRFLNESGIDVHNIRASTLAQRTDFSIRIWNYYNVDIHIHHNDVLESIRRRIYDAIYRQKEFFRLNGRMPT